MFCARAGRASDPKMQSRIASSALLIRRELEWLARKAALKRPYSKRWRETPPASACAQRLECGRFSAAVSSSGQFIAKRSLTWRQARHTFIIRLSGFVSRKSLKRHALSKAQMSSGEKRKHMLRTLQRHQLEKAHRFVQVGCDYNRAVRRYRREIL